MRWIGVGLLLAGTTGGGLAVRPSFPDVVVWLSRAFPWSASIPLASALLFDLGVFSLVVGATVLMLIAIGASVDPQPSAHLVRDRCAAEPSMRMR